MRGSEGSGVDMSYNGPQIAMIRNPLRGGSVPYEEWMDYASCQSLPAEYFELSDHLMDSVGEAPEEQHRLISLGLRVCNDCPVKRSCLVNSDEDDRHWTTRGGQPPEGLFPNKGGGAHGKRAETFIRGKMCNKGHDKWAKRGNGKVYCWSCKQISEASRTRPPRGRNRHPKAV
jgi:hypothetical protein